jgi:hypothetical protein
LLAAAVIGILAGIYPAFYLSGFKPAEVLKGKLASGSKSSVNAAQRVGGFPIHHIHHFNYQHGGYL